MGGLRYIVGEPDRPPSRVGISIGDSLAGVHACMGILAALHHRERTGVGQMVDAAIYESVLNMMESLVTEYDQLGHVRERSGAILPRIAPSNVYPTRDGIVMIGANQDTVFARLCTAMQSPALASRLALPGSRGARHAPAGTRRHHRASGPRRSARASCSNLLEKHGVPSGLIYRTADMLDDPHFEAREAIVSYLASALRHAANAERRASTVAQPGFDPHTGARGRPAQRRDLSGRSWVSTPQRLAAYRVKRA